jgi:deoxyribose-phosphate aldolase
MSLNIAAYIDHTILQPATTLADIEKLCSEAAAYQFAAVCVPPYFIGKAKKLLAGTEVKVATVIGFPFGYNTINAKLQELTEAIDAGADELDIVHNIIAVKNRDWDYNKHEIKAATHLVHAAGKVIKVIVESGLLSDEELIKCCDIYSACGIDFMKTSTGYAAVGATVHAVELMRKHLPAQVQIKASGGIRTFTFAKELVDAGANRLGCSASLQIVKESNE